MGNWGCRGIDNQLVPRISRAAVGELQQMRLLLSRVALSDQDDRRRSPLVNRGDVLRSTPVYNLLMATTGAPPCSFAKFVWGARVPPRVQFFAWLLVQERVQCRANLLKKHVLDDACCEVCAEEEDCNHIIRAPLLLQYGLPWAPTPRTVQLLRCGKFSGPPRSP